MKWPTHAANILSHTAARCMGMKDACMVGSALMIRERRVTELGHEKETR